MRLPRQSATSWSNRAARATSPSATSSFAMASTDSSPARALLASPAISHRTRHTQQPGGLSVREAAVLRLLAAGRSNNEIAEALTLSPHTVVRHVSNVYDKIGASGRAEAVRWAFANGLGPE